MRNLIAFFTTRHLVTNVIFFGLMVLSIFAWKSIGKEELPEFASNWVRVTTIYPGAPAEDVELFVSKPIEDELKGVVGIDEVLSTSSVGVSSFRIVIDDDYPKPDEVVSDIKDAVLRVNFPSEVRDLPYIRQFKSSEKAILDIGMYHKNYKELDQASREVLQQYILSFENQLLALNEISSIGRSHYRKPEIQILVDPKIKRKVELSLSDIKNQIKTNHVRVPIGSMSDKGESKVTALNEYESVESFSSLILRGNYEGFGVKLSDIATIKKGFEKTSSIFKVNGHEGVFLNIKKSVSVDILTAQNKVMNFIKTFKENNKEAPIGIVLMDDESYAVTNRLNIVSSNGLLGFVLIVVVLLCFLNFKAGFWVAMGIPFSMAFTLMIAHLVGYTVNNMTLAGIIIVLGIVVDDAIIVAENIARKSKLGLAPKAAAIEGTLEVCKPIVASIVTTCIAFTPLIFFEGFFGKLVGFIPLIVILMLCGSLIESLFILPSHISGKTFIIDKFSKGESNRVWFDKFEKYYENFLLKVFRGRFLVLILFGAILGGAIFIFQTKMKYVMFPREESEEVVVKVEAPKGTIRQETARLIEPLEVYAVNDSANVVGVRSSIALSRRGGEVKENEASILIELHPADDRNMTTTQLINKWEEYSKSVAGLESVKFLRGRWGRDSGSAIELQIQENNDESRLAIAATLAESMKQIKDITDVEIEDPLIKREFIVRLKQDRLIKYQVAPETVTSSLRSFVEGSILYSINKGEEEVDVRLTVPEKVKQDLNELLDLRVENKNGQLVYLRNMVDIEEVERPVNISRTNYKRTTMIYADINPKAKLTPLEAAEIMETEIFPKVTKKYPTVIFKFRGEIEDSRESQGEFLNSILIAVIFIYLVLIIMFNSLFKPLLVLSIVPFGLGGIVYVLLAHNMLVYGFFAVVGALGMIGVVVNDAIVMIDRIENRLKEPFDNIQAAIAEVVATRLRPILVTTISTVVGILPTAYGFAGYDSMLAEMMLTMGWGLAFGTVITLVLIPCLYSFRKG